TWTAPGNVSIEEGFAHIGVGSHAATTPGGYNPNPPPAHQAMPAHSQFAYNQGFQPQAPVEAPRSVRRMPDVEDFPVVGQREWHAKQSGTSPDAAKAGGGGRKGGFFSRFGKKPAELGHHAGENTVDGGQTSGDDMPLPVFFGSERR
ncbi:MAG: hypothetical protein WBP38_08615, partial [Hyphomicrobium sp.]